MTASTHGRTIAFDLPAGQTRTLGRGKECDVCVNDKQVSRTHCELSFTAGKVIAKDLGSSHGITFHGTSHTTVEIEVGDGFHIGQTFVRFQSLFVDNATVPIKATVPTKAKPAPSPPTAGPGPELVRIAAPQPLAQAAQQVRDELARESDETSRSGPPRRRRRSSRPPTFLARMVGELIVFTTVMSVGTAVLLVLKVKWPEIDIYRILDWFDLPKR